MTTSEILRAARQELEQHGWIQGEYYEFGSGHCLVGALDEVTGATCQESVYLAVVLALGIPRNGRNAEGILIDWNDDASRKFGEVVQLLEDAARLEDSAHAASLEQAMAMTELIEEELVTV